MLIFCLSDIYAQIQTGAQQPELYLSLLENKKVALVVNQTSTVGSQHLVDFLLEKKINIQLIFAPEHGFRGDADAGEKVKNSKDVATNIPLISLYGKTYRPSAEHLSGIDVVLFDIQDVGVRCYTYISTLHYVMESCAEFNKTLLVLDRPNPNGFYVDGFVRDSAQKSFVGMQPIPMVHGLTVGELAKMIVGEKWINNFQNLTVISCKNYDHSMKYSLPVRPSPNLPNDLAIELYPSLVLFEGTNISMGRGTDFPFQVLGVPLENIKDESLKNFSFTPQSNSGSKEPPYKNILCYGTDFRQPRDWKTNFSLSPLLEYYKKTDFKGKPFFNSFFKRLAGTERLEKMILEGKNEEEIRQSWQAELEKYKEMRKKYLLYKDFE